jgi:hypothetical protein
MDWKRHKQKPKRRRITPREQADADARRRFELMRLGMLRERGTIEIVVPPKPDPAEAGNP